MILMYLGLLVENIILLIEKIVVSLSAILRFSDYSFRKTFEIQLYAL